MRFSLSLLVTLALFGQAPPDRPAFEVVDVQPSKITTFRKEAFLPSGRVELPGMTLKVMIMASYGVQENMVVGGPKWIDTDRFDVVAKAPPSTPIPRLLLMTQSMLADQFKLVIHREEKALPAYALVRGKKALKLQPSEGTGRQTCNWQPADAGRMQRVCHNMAMAEMARQLPGWGPARVDLPVVDQTGLKGTFDFTLEISTPGKTEKRAGEGAAPDLAEITFFDALEQVGLKLEQRKMPLQVIVVDRAERPAGN